jgi:hypothetical protein
MVLNIQSATSSHLHKQCHAETKHWLLSTSPGSTQQSIVDTNGGKPARKGSLKRLSLDDNSSSNDKYLKKLNVAAFLSSWWEDKRVATDIDGLNTVILNG